MSDTAAVNQKPGLDAQAFRLPGRLTLAGAPEGADARWLAEALADPHMPPVLAVAMDEEKALRLLAGVRFFAPKTDALFLPAWDCLPYDRSSPQADVLSARIAALGRLAERAPRLLVTTVNALVQRVPPRSFFENARFSAKKGERLDLDELTAFLAANGYNRTDTVMEPGEYAVRGGLIDLFPPAEEQPLRLDLFGDEIETIRRFDPLNQRSTGEVTGIAIAPVNELRLTRDAIERFRVGYRTAFGIPGAGRPPVRERQRRPQTPRHGALAAAVPRPHGDPAGLPARRRRIDPGRAVFRGTACPLRHHRRPLHRPRAAGRNHGERRRAASTGRCHRTGST